MGSASSTSETTKSTTDEASLSFTLFSVETLSDHVAVTGSAFSTPETTKSTTDEDSLSFNLSSSILESTSVETTLLTSTEITTESVMVSDLEREGRGEAEACVKVGSCHSRCGGGSDLTCWCDQRCVTAGDCCCDYEPQCVTNTSTTSSSGSPTSPLEEVTEDGFSLGNVNVPEIHTKESCLSSGGCLGRCGGGSDVDCWCDQDCVHNGDCCCDRELLCHSQDAPETTGCQSTGTCESRCGSGSDQDCWCDEQCDIRGDCCCESRC